MELATAIETLAKPSIRQSQEGQRFELENTDCGCSYNCTFTWKVPEVHLKLTTGKVLYSPPFYTGQNGGYKMCLFLYMDGDGSGKGTHLSFFFALMRGEYDALLTWPFKQKVTLILQDQDQQQHIAKWFKPDLSNAVSINSFQRPSPNSDLNIASGCPEFVPLSIMDNSSYVKDGTMIFRCTVDTTETNI